MEDFFWRVLAVSLTVSVVLLPLLVLGNWLEGRWAAGTRWGLWLAVSGVLLVTPLFPRHWSEVPVVLEAPAYTVILPASEPLRPVQTAEPEAPAVVVETQGAALPSVPLPEAAERTEPQPAPLPPTVTLAELAAAVWLAGVIALLVGQSVRYLVVRRQLMRASVATEEPKGLEENLGVQVSFRRLPGLESPMTMGLTAWPVIFLPEGETNPMALRHELCHVRRHDTLGKAVLFAACALHWFNPLVWHMARTAGRDVEAACDAQVAAGLDTEERRAYGELLLAVAGGGKSVPLTTCFGGGKEEMRRRLTQLFRPGKRHLPVACLLLAVALLLTGTVVLQEKRLSDGEYYALYDGAGHTGGYDRMSFQLVRFSPGADQVGEVWDTVRLPLAPQLRLGDHMTGEEREKDIMNYLNWPVLRSYALPDTTDVLRLEVAEGQVTALDWFEGITPVEGLLDAESYTLQLPADWVGRYATVGGSDTSGARTTSYYLSAKWDVLTGRRNFFDGKLFTIHTMEEAAFHRTYPGGAADLEARGLRYLGSGGGAVYYASFSDGQDWDAPSKGREEEYEAMVAQAKAWLGPERFTYAGDRKYVNEGYGLTLWMPKSWTNQVRVEETGEGLSFSYRYTGAMLPSLVFRPERLTPEEEASAGLRYLGGQEGFQVYLTEPQADTTLRGAEASRYQIMYRDGLREASWGLNMDDAPLYVNTAFGYSVRLPESWAGRYRVEEESPNYTVFYQLEDNTDEARPLMCLRVTGQERFDSLYGEKNLLDVYKYGGPWISLVGSVGERVVYVEIDPYEVPEQPKDEMEEAYISLRADALWWAPFAHLAQTVAAIPEGQVIWSGKEEKSPIENPNQALKDMEIAGISGFPLDELDPALLAQLTPEGEAEPREGVGFWRKYTAPGLELTTSRVTPETLKEWAESQAEYDAELGREYVMNVRVTAAAYSTGAGISVGGPSGPLPGAGLRAGRGDNYLPRRLS